MISMDVIIIAWNISKNEKSKTAWEKEQKVMYDAIYDKWDKEGKDWKEKVDTCRKAWENWLTATGLTKLSLENIQDAKDIWEKWQHVSQSLHTWQKRKDDLQSRITQWRDGAEQLFREIGITADITPEQVETVYKQWQQIRVQAEVAKEQDKQQKERDAQIEELKKDKEIRKRQQQDLLVLTGAQTVGEFRSKVLKFRQFKQYKEIYEQSEAHIRLIAKNPKNLAALRHELKIHTLKNWTDERTYYEKKIAESEKKLAEVAEKRGTFIERLSQMAKSDTYNKLLQEKRKMQKWRRRIKQW